MNKKKTLFKVSLVSIALLFLLVSSTALAVTEKNASPKITETRITTSVSASHPDIYGDKIVWKDGRNEETGDIYMYDIPTKKETQITTEGYASNPAIYGNSVVWEDWGGEECNIYMYNLTTKKTTQISTSGSANYPVIYDDRILWQDFFNSIVYMYDLTTKKETQIITDGPAYHYDISADRIVYGGYSNMSLGIYVYDLYTNKETQISNNTGVPAIYGDRIAWEEERNGNADIYTYDLSTKKQIQITSSPDAQGSPAIYGNRIVWEDDGGEDDGWENHGIYMYDISTNQKIKISTSGGTIDPQIYGNNVVWEDWRSGNPDIYMATLSTTSPIAAFSASPTSGKAPLKVTFTDKSTGSPTSWKWSFGDGTYSTSSNPIHKYSQEGNYTVKLTATNAAGSSTTTKTNYIKVATNTRPGIYSESK